MTCCNLVLADEVVAEDETLGLGTIARNRRKRDRLKAAILLALRDDLRGRLGAAETIDPAWLAMLADTETVLAALDCGDDRE